VIIPGRWVEFSKRKGLPMEIDMEWNKLAIELDFQLKHEIRPLVELPSLHKMGAHAVKTGDIHKAKKILEHPMVAEILSKAFVGSATGVYRGYECAVFRSCNDKDSSYPVYYVNVVLVFKEKYRFGLEISKNGFLSKIGKLIRPGAYVKIPENSLLDRTIVVKAKNKEAVQRLVSNRSLQEKLFNLYVFSNSFEITDRDIRYSERGTIIDKEKATKVMDMMTEVASEFP
jgi:hypothetical protein